MCWMSERTVIHTAVSESLVQLVVGAMTCLCALVVARRRSYGPAAHPGWLNERAMVHSGVLPAVPGFAGPALGSQVFRHRQRRYAELAAAILLLMGAATVVAAGWHMTS